jgi:hypothetical protein
MLEEAPDELLQGRGGRLEKQGQEFARVSADRPAQSRRDRESQQVVGDAGQEQALLAREPQQRVGVPAGRAVAIAAGAVREERFAAPRALPADGAQGGGVTGGQRAHGTEVLSVICVSIFSRNEETR